MKKLVFAAILLFAGIQTYAQYDPKALEILEAMSKKYKAITAFEANLTSGLSNESEGVKVAVEPGDNPNRMVRVVRDLIEV